MAGTLKTYGDAIAAVVTSGVSHKVCVCTPR
jgi:hypothetical protein